MKTLADRLKARREELGMTKAGLRRAAGLKSPSTLTELENGTIVHTPQLPEIARALGVTPFWLKTGKGHRLEEGLSAIPSLRDSGTRRGGTAPYDPQIMEAIRLMENTDDDGRLKALMGIKFALKDHVPAKKGRHLLSA